MGDGGGLGKGVQNSHVLFVVGGEIIQRNTPSKCGWPSSLRSSELRTRDTHVFASGGRVGGAAPLFKLYDEPAVQDIV